jgi:teichoic acid transport system ATP-binding protein
MEKDCSTVSLCHVRVAYAAGSRREDVKSRVLNLLSEKSAKKEFAALDNLTFEAFSGEIVGVVGSNGAGKTTLCRVIAGVLQPDSGTAKIYGQVSALLTLGAGFDIKLTGRENIYLNAMMLGFSRKAVDGVCDQIIDFSGLNRFIDQPVKTYSSGMRGRLGFSIAAMIRPDILILDEALSAGDLEFSEKAGKKIQQIISEARLVLVVSHNMEFIKRFCTRAVWIEKGRIIGDGSPERVTDKYLEKSGAPGRKKRAPRVERLSGWKIGNSRVIQVKEVSLAYHVYEAKKKWFHGPGKKKSCHALKDLSLSVRHGEIMGIIGPNGAGKTTLCRILAGILKPDRGTVLVDGRVMSLLSFGTGFDIQLTGRDNVFLNGMMLGFSRSWLEKKYDEIESFAEIGKFMDRPVKQYSSGMRTRLGFAIAAAVNPDIFVIDEALNAGDASFYEKASMRIQNMMRSARATIVVSHDMNFVRTICTRVAWIDHGHLVGQGPPAKIVSRYRRSVRHAKN